MDHRPAVMTVDELAHYLRVHTMTIYRLIRRGQLPAVRVGRAWRFRKDQLNEWLHDREMNANHGNGRRARPASPRGSARGRR
jgi:excisionase family DNA binding protein